MELPALKPRHSVPGTVGSRISSVPVASDHPPSAPPITARDPEETELLLRFVHERNIHCPRCDYNLRNLTQPVCPECREELRLTVGQGRPRFGWLIAALAPGIFSGIAAVLFAVPLILIPILRPGPKGPPWQAYAMDAFGWLSALIAITLFVQRFRFLSQSHAVQATWAGVTWFIHIGFLVILFAVWR